MTDEKTGIRPKVGDRVWVGRGSKFEYKTVAKVGKKYFYLEKPYERAQDVRFVLGCKNGSYHDTEWTQNAYVVYESEDASREELDNRDAVEELKFVTMLGSGWFRYKRPDNVTASDIRRAITILKGEDK